MATRKPKQQIDADESAELTKVNGGWLTHDRAIEVSQDDIDHGVERDQWGCAIVRAIQRKYPEAMRVRVNINLVGFSINETRYTFPTPEAIVESIIQPFDTGHKAEIEPQVVVLTGGKMKDVVHSSDRARSDKRNDGRERRTQRKLSARENQMSPSYHEFNRFRDNNA